MDVEHRWWLRAALSLLLTALIAAGASPVRALSEDRRFSDYALDNWTVADGLPQVAVQALAQDGDGYLWVGTQSSIARFDGVRFEAFDRRRIGVDTAMSEDSYRASDGHVWFATRNGAIRLRRDKAEHFSAAGTAVPMQTISEWPVGQMLFGTARGLYALQDGALVPAGLEGMDVSALLDVGPVLWIGTRGRLLRREGGLTRSIALPGGSDLRITHLTQHGGRLWMATSRGLWFMEGDGEPQPFMDDERLTQRPIETLCTDSGGSLWISTAPRLFRLKSDGELLALDDAQFVRNPWVNACLEDREGNFWLGSQTESLFRAWDGLVARLGEADGLADPFVWALEGDGQGGVLIGTNSGLVSWKNGAASLLVPGSVLPNSAVYELARLDDNRLWIGTRGGLRERVGGKIVMPEGAVAIEGLQVNTIVSDGDARWVGTSGGLFRHTDRDGLKPVGVGAFDGTALRIRAVLPLDERRVLLGTEDGIRLVDGAQVSVPDWAQFLAGRMVTSLLRLADGRLVIGTLDSGLAVVGSGRAIALDDSSIMPTLNAWTTRAHGDWLYVSSIEGLYRIRLSSLPDPGKANSEDALKALDVSWVISMAGRNQSGQRARCCNGGARSRALLVGDQLWLPSISGVLRVDLDAIGSTSIDALVHVESATYDGQRHVTRDGVLTLSDRRDVRFDFTAIHFRSPGAMRFDYRLDGYDPDWIEAGERRSAFYTNLPPGKYRFLVRAEDEFGKTIHAGESLDLIVPPRWSERPLIRAIGVLLALALVAVGVMLTLSRQRRRTALLEALVHERTDQLQRANERLEHANAVLSVESQTDTLTGLPNRRSLFQQMPAMLEKHPKGVVLALVDIDHFKRVNDEYGHATGDVVLRDFAAFLRRATRDGDLLARWGGEEFLIVFGGLPDEAVPARIQRLLDDGRSVHFDLGRERPLEVRFSVGWTRHPLGASTMADWKHALELADAALYRAKANGRNTWVGLVAGERMGQTALEGHPGKRIDELVAENRLQWLNLPTRGAAAKNDGRAG